MALLHLLHSQQELLKPFNAESALKLLRSILRVVLCLLFQRQCLFDLCLKEVPVKAEEREPHYNGEGHDASDVGEAWHDLLRVFLVGVYFVTGEEESGLWVESVRALMS